MRTNKIYKSLALFLSTSLFAFSSPQEKIQKTPLIKDINAEIPSQAQYVLLADYETGVPIAGKKIDEPMSPSSMTKILTAYVVMKKIKDGRISLDTKFRVSRNAFRLEGSTTFLNVGDEVSVLDLLKGLIIQSGNDAAVVLAEGIAGTEAAFAIEMNRTAKALGAANTHVVNASGLPHKDHKTTARDLVLISRALIQNFPDLYYLWGIQEYTYANSRQMNRNPLLYRNMGCDGIKTGSAKAAGYGMVASCKRGDRRFILVVNGLKTQQARADEAVSITNWGFSTFENYPLHKKGDVVAKIPVWFGEKTKANLVVSEDITLTLKYIDKNEIKINYLFDKQIDAPVRANQVMGSVEISAPGLEQNLSVPLVVEKEIKAGGIFSKLSDYVVQAFGGRKYQENA